MSMYLAKLRQHPQGHTIVNNVLSVCQAVMDMDDNEFKFTLLTLLDTRLQVVRQNSDEEITPSQQLYLNHLNSIKRTVDPMVRNTYE